MFDEDGQTPQSAQIAIGDNLAILSIDDLRSRRELLLAEIERVDAELSSKRAGKAAAEAFFTNH